MSDYKSILKTSWDAIPEPKTLPVGSWLLVGQGATFKAPADDTKSPQILFVYGVKTPMDDVDEGELANLGPDYDYGINKVYARFFVGENSDWHRVRQHLGKHGIDVEGLSIEETLKAFRGTEVIAFLDQRTYVNGSGQEVEENNPTSFIPVA